MDDASVYVNRARSVRPGTKDRSADDPHPRTESILTTAVQGAFAHGSPVCVDARDESIDTTVTTTLHAPTGIIFAGSSASDGTAAYFPFCAGSSCFVASCAGREQEVNARTAREIPMPQENAPFHTRDASPRISCSVTKIVLPSTGRRCCCIR